MPYMSPPVPHFGEFLAVACAAVWGLAVVFFKKSGEAVHPLALNLFKDVLAIVLLAPTIWIAGQVAWHQTTASAYGILLLSGALGIGVADTLFFIALNRLGAGLTAIVDCLYSPSVILLAVIWLGEGLSWPQIIGVIVIVSAVFIATFERPHGNHSRAAVRWGIVFGALAMLFNAVGVILAKPLLADLPLLWVTEVRLVGGTIALLAVLAVHPGRKEIMQTLQSSHHRLYTFFGSFFGAYISMVLWLGGMKYTQASIAAALNQTSNIFIFVMAAVFLNERITLKRAIGITLGVGGAYLVMFA